MTLLIVYPGFGDYNSEIKQDFVLKLLRLISLKTDDFKVRIFCHGEQKLSKLETITNLEIIYERGIIGQFLYKYITSQTIIGFSHIMIVMDDIEVFDDFDINFYLSKTEECDIISPCLTNDSLYSHDYMLQSNGNGNGLIQVKSLELFMYIMSHDSYIRYYDTFFDKFVSWLWYIDIIFAVKGFKCLLNFDNAVKHHYRGSSVNVNALLESIHNKRKHIFPRRIVQTTHSDTIKNLFSSFDYFVVDLDAFVKSEYSSEFSGNECNQVYNTWKCNSNSYFIAVCMYLYKYGGIWIHDTFNVKNIDMVNRIIETVEKGLILNNEIIFTKAGDENLYSLLISNSIVNPKTFGCLDEHMINNLITQ